MDKISVREFRIIVPNDNTVSSLHRLYPSPLGGVFIRAIDQVRNNPGQTRAIGSFKGMLSSISSTLDARIILTMKPDGGLFSLYTASLFHSYVKQLPSGRQSMWAEAVLAGGDERRRNQLEALIQQDYYWSYRLPEAEKDYLS